MHAILSLDAVSMSVGWMMLEEKSISLAQQNSLELLLMLHNKLKGSVVKQKYKDNAVYILKL